MIMEVSEKNSRKRYFQISRTISAICFREMLSSTVMFPEIEIKWPSIFFNTLSRPPRHPTSPPR
jgi:hypothetical protein